VRSATRFCSRNPSEKIRSWPAEYTCANRVKWSADRFFGSFLWGPLTKLSVTRPKINGKYDITFVLSFINLPKDTCMHTGSKKGQIQIYICGTTKNTSLSERETFSWYFTVKRLTIFPSPAGMSLTKAGDGKMANLFYSVYVAPNLFLISKYLWETVQMLILQSPEHDLHFYRSIVAL
jgi:hypothetical protein